MEIKEFFDKDTSTLTYILHLGSDAILIDPVLNFDPNSGKITQTSVEQILAFLKQKKLQLHWIFETHAHADHISGAAALKSHLPSVKTAIGEHIVSVQQIFTKVFNLKTATDGRQFDRLLKDGEVLPVGDMRLKVHATPGHTPACVSYEVNGHIFTGDTLFMPDSGTGRCDFPGASASDLYDSIQTKIYSLPSGTKMYVGHDYQPNGRPLQFSTTVLEQMEKNIHIKKNTTKLDFMQFRTARDKTLAVPRLLLPSIQVNIDGAKLPEPEENGVRYLKLPLSLE